MVSQDERLKILEMVRDGKLTAEQGIQLLEALKSANPPESAVPPQPPALPARHPRWFRVTVTDMRNGKLRVNVRLPVNVLTAGIKMGARFSTDVEGLDMNQLMEMARSGEIGRIVDIINEENGEHVEVFLE